MRPYTMDLRERVAAAVDDGQWSQRRIARLFRVSVSFVSRLLKRRREVGTLGPEPHRGGPPRVLSIAQRCRLWDLVKEHNDYTLEELRQAGGFDCCTTTIWRALRRHGLTRGITGDYKPRTKSGISGRPWGSRPWGSYV